MTNRTITLAILGGLILSIVIPFAIPASVSAQACTDARGNPIECPASQDNGKKKKPSPTRPRDYKTATPTPATFQTPTTVPTQAQLPTATKIPPAVLPADDSHLLTNSFAGPFAFWWLGLLALLLGGGLGFVGFFNRRKLPPEPPIKPGSESAYHKGDMPGFDKMEAQPHMQPGADTSSDDWEMPGSDNMEAQPHMKPGTDASSDDWELPEPHMQPGESPPPDPDSVFHKGDTPGADQGEAQPHMKPGEDGFVK